MAYTRAWDETRPNGATTQANTIDTEFQYLRVDLRERITDIFGMAAVDFDSDPVVPRSLALTKGTITDDAQVISATVTWNDAADTFTAIKLNVTNTNSAAASKLIDLQTGAVTMFNVTRAGIGTFAGGLTVSAGTTAVQAFTATTGVFSSTVSLTTLTATSNGAHVFGSDAGAALTVAFNGAAATTRQLVWRTASVARWVIRASATAETGSDAGSNFAVDAYDDAGVYIDSPLSITRAASGTVTITRTISHTGTSASISSSTTTATLNVGSGTGSGVSQIGIRGAAGQTRQLMFMSGNTLRWSLVGANTTAESGSNAGSNLNLNAYDDAGTIIDSPISIARASGGVIAFSRIISSGTTPATSGQIRLPNNTSISWRDSANASNITMTVSSNDNWSVNSSVAAGLSNTFSNTGGGSNSVIVSANAGATRDFAINTGSTRRWAWRGSSTAESGSDAGSNLQLLAYNDAGSSIDVPISVARATGGSITIVRPLTTNQNLSVTAGTTAVQALTATTGVFTGQITGQAVVNIFGLGGGASQKVIINGAAATLRDITWQTASTDRWTIRASNDAESGSNAGTNLQIIARDDAGTIIDTPISISRAAGGTMTLARPVSMSSTLAVTGNITGSASIFAAAGNNLGFSGRSNISAPADGIIRLSNNAINDFTRLQLGGTTSSFPSIKRNSAAINFRLADDSADADITAAGITASSVITSTNSIIAGAGFTLGWTGRSRISSPANGTIILFDTGLSTFTLLGFGGTTSSFPAIKRNGAALNFRLADDSADAAITAAAVTTTTVTSSGLITANAGLTVASGQTLTLTGVTVTGLTISSLTLTDTLTSTLGTIVASTPAFSSTATWNNAGVTFQHFLINVTNTASNIASTLIDVQVGGTSWFNVARGGISTFGTWFATGLSGGHSGIGAAARLYLDGIAGSGNTYLQEQSADNVRLVVGGVDSITVQTTVITFNVSATGTYVFAGTGTSVSHTMYTGNAGNARQGNILIADGTAPAGNPANGGYLFSEAGAGKWRGSGGTVTTFGPAEPHCPVCGSDFGHEWENPKYGGKLQICMKCLVADVAPNKPYVRYVN